MGAAASTSPVAQTGDGTASEPNQRSLTAQSRQPNTPSADSSNDASRGSIRTSSMPRTDSFTLINATRVGPVMDRPELPEAAAAMPNEDELEMDDARSVAPTSQASAAPTTTNGTSAASTRRGWPGRQRKLSSVKPTRPPAVVNELWKELSLVKRNIFSRKPWIDGLSVMWIVLSNTITSVVIAWQITLIYAIGSPIAPVVSFTREDPVPSSASSHSGESLLFATAIGSYFVVFACLSHAITKCHTLAERLQSVHTTLRHVLRRTLVGYFCVAAPFMAVATVAGASAMALLDHFQIDYVACGRAQLVALGVIAALYVDYAQRHARELRRRMVDRMALQSTTPSEHHAHSRRVSNAPSADAIGVALDSSAAVVSLASTTSPLRRTSATLNHTVVRAPYQRDTIPFLQRVIRSHRGFTVLCMVALFAYMHLSLALRLERKWEILLFAAFSLLLKIAIQEATKRLFLQAASKPSARATHMIMTMPTVLLDAHIRMVFVQLGQGSSSSSSASSSSSSSSSALSSAPSSSSSSSSALSSAPSSSSVLTSSFVIVICKIVFRLAKILKLRATVKQRLSHSKGMQRILKRVNSKIAVRDVAVARAEYAQFLDWKNYMLRLHAAEVYADMHGEYISIGLATAIVFFFTHHPMYALQSASTGTVSSQIFSALVQLATGLVFDYIASVVEGVHEVPLYEAIGDEGRGLRVFMHVLLGAITVVNVGIVAVFLLHRPGDG